MDIASEELSMAKVKLSIQGVIRGAALCCDPRATFWHGPLMRELTNW